MSDMWNHDPQYADHVLGWDGEQWAYATVRRWSEDDGSRIIPAKELLGDLPGLDDITRPPRCDHTFGEVEVWAHTDHAEPA